MGNARASTWDKREVEHPTSFRLTLITLNPGSWRHKGKGITMNTINGMSFYDSLTKLTIGFLLTWWHLPKILYSNIQIQDKDLHDVLFIALYVVACYLTGCLWQLVSCVFPQDNTLDNKDKDDSLCSYIPWGKTNYLPWIKEKKHEVEKEFTSAISSDEEDKNVKYEYFKAYFKVQKSGLMGNVPILEAHEAFLRYATLPFIAHCFYGVYILSKGHKFEDGIGALLFIISLIVIFLYLSLWKYYNRKVYRLVWEAKFFLDKLEKEEQDNAPATKNEKQDISCPATEKEQ